MNRVTPRRWEELALAFTVATALFALPLYVTLNASPGLVELARLVVVFHLLPTVVLLTFMLVLARWRALGRAYRIAIALAGLASVARALQLQSDVEFSWAPPWLTLGAMLSLGIAVVVVGRGVLDWLPRGFARVAPPVAVISAVFIGVLSFGGRVNGLAATPSVMREDAAFIFIFDELGQDVLGEEEIDAEQFPHFARLAGDGLWLSDATTNYAATCQAVPAMLTGRARPVCRQALPVDEDSLLRVLASSYRVQIYEPHLLGCPAEAEICKGIPYLTSTYPHVALGNHFIPPTIRMRLIRALDELGDGFSDKLLWADFVDQVRRVDLRGRFFFVHLLLPHVPYIYRADGTLNESSHTQFRGTADDILTYANYREQVRFVDSLFGQFVDVLRDRNAYRNATIVVTGDHGPRPGFVPPPVLRGVSAETPHVPFILKSPGLQSRPVSDVEYQHLDLAPSVLDVLGLLGDHSDFEGRSIFRADLPPREKWFVSDNRLFIRQPNGVWRIKTTPS